ncbi:MAG: TonB-dependent receptor, partial [Pseudomonadota bacterium]
MRGAHVVIGLMAALFAAGAGPPCFAATLAGRSLVAALGELNSPSLRFIYSSQLLPDTLRVTREPTAATPLGQARELLAPFGLTVVPVAADVYAVAKITPATQTPAVVAAAVVAPLQPGPVEPAEALVTGERYPLGIKRADDSMLFSAARLSAQPGLGEDVLSSLAHIPGITRGALSGRLSIRGGGPEETLILMDGFPIRQAYHMSGYRGPLSIIDPGTLSEIGLYFGAIPARYGDRLSGVLDLRSLVPNDTPRNSLGLGFLNARARTDLELGRGDDDLLISARYGSTGYLVRTLEPAASSPRYGDLYARLRVAVGATTDVTVNTMIARDRLAVRRNGFQETSQMDSDLAYFWLNSRTALPLANGETARLSLWLGNSDLDTNRAGVLASPGFAAGQLDERRRARILDFRSNLQWPWGDQHVLEAGLDLSRGTAAYRYRSDVQFAPGIAASLNVPDANRQSFDLQPSRFGSSAYLSDTWAVMPRLTAQLGLRVSRTDASDSRSVTSWDPRVSVSWQVAPATTLRSAWGQVHQISDLSEIVPGRDPAGGLIGQQSQYFVFGVDQAIAQSLLLRLEAFEKHQVHLLPLQRNLLRSPSILPELSLDRVWLDPRAARIRGVELYLQQTVRDYRWSVAYSLSRASEMFPQGSAVRSGDQRHLGSATLDWTHDAWIFSGALEYRSGLPTTTFATNDAGGLVIGARNASRLAGSIGLDLRARWRHPLAVGSLSITAQVSNLF